MDKYRECVYTVRGERKEIEGRGKKKKKKKKKRGRKDGKLGGKKRKELSLISQNCEGSPGEGAIGSGDFASGKSDPRGLSTFLFVTGFPLILFGLRD